MWLRCIAHREVERRLLYWHSDLGRRITMGMIKVAVGHVSKIVLNVCGVKISVDYQYLS